jgi:putative endonuclease
MPRSGRPGTHFPEACVYGFRARRCAAPRNDGVRGFGLAYCVYLLASQKHGTLYLGVTQDLIRRVYEHKNKLTDGFTAKYGVDRLVWFEVYDDPATAITREKALKKWRHNWKIRLIEEDNPDWADLYSSLSAATPGNSLPSSHSRKAPPAVET